VTRRLVRAIAVSSVLSVALAQAWPQQVPSFRTQVTLVPLDVRVVDSRGQPVLNLKPSDFTVLEDGVPQEIRHFIVQGVVAEKPGEGGERPPVRVSSADELVPQRGRVFLIVLGRGRLQEPSKGLDGLIRFVREPLLPQDYAAIMAYNRATDFTRDREKLAGVLERFKAKNDWLETNLKFALSGLQGWFATDIPRHIQKEIDGVFGHAARTTGVPVGTGELGRLDQEAWATTGDILERDSRATRTKFAFQMFDELLVGPGFDEYVSSKREATDDIQKILGGIDYLSRFDGEKHLVWVTEKGPMMPKEADGDAALAKVANDARVAISMIQTGGLDAPSGGSPQDWPSLASWSRLQSVVNIPFLTGGRSFRFSYVRDALDSINRATLSGYLIGYYPTKKELDGRYRRVEVKVNRRGVTAMFRHGYYASNEPVVDRRTFLTLRRISAAGGYPADVPDIGVRLQARVEKGASSGSAEVAVELTIDPSRLSFVEEGGQHIITLDIAIFCTDGRERVIGDTWKKATLKLSEETYQTVRRQGLRYAIRVSVKGTPRFVKAIVYDYGADLVGSRIVKLK